MRPLALAVVLPLLTLAGACTGPRVPPGVRAGASGPLTPAFQGMRSLLVRLAAPRSASDAASLRAASPRVLEHGMGLLRSTLPHDLREADEARYLEGRAVFGEALKGWANAAGGSDDALLFDAYDRLVEAYWGWVDAYQGLPPERSV